MPEKPRNREDSDKFSLCILSCEEEFCYQPVKEFNCADDDLNEFFREDAFPHKDQLLAETYYFQPIEATVEDLFYPVAFVSFLNDSITIEREERKGLKREFFKEIRKTIPFKKRWYESFPAVKIGRLGVHKDYQDLGIGTDLLNLTKKLFLRNNRTGCRYLTVDAYNSERVIRFYEKNGFAFLEDQNHQEDTPEDGEHEEDPAEDEAQEDPTRIMYYDLKRHQEE